MNDRDEMTHEINFGSLTFGDCDDSCEHCGGVLSKHGHPAYGDQCLDNPDRDTA